MGGGGAQLVPRWGGGTGSEIVARPPNFAVLLTRCGQLILRKISKFDAIRRHILRIKCTKFDFRWAAPETPLGELTALPQTRSLIKRPTYKGRAREVGEGKREGKWR